MFLRVNLVESDIRRYKEHFDIIPVKKRGSRLCEPHAGISRYCLPSPKGAKFSLYCLHQLAKVLCSDFSFAVCYFQEFLINFLKAFLGEVKTDFSQFMF